MTDPAYPAHLPKTLPHKTSPLETFLMGVLVVMVFVVLALGAFLGLALAGFPLQGPLARLAGLEQPAPAAQPVPPVTGVETAGAQTAGEAASDTQASSTSSAAASSTGAATSSTGANATSAGMCGATGSLTILFSGVDFAGGVWPEGADAVRVVKVNFDRQKVSVVAFPRDLWVRTTSLAGLGVDYQRLGLAYDLKHQSTSGTGKQKTIAATMAVGQALYDTFGVEPEHYFTMQMSNVAEMVDALGGVEVIVPEAFVSDRGVSYPAGAQTLNGPLALEYVRTFNPGGDAARILRQNQFVWGVQKKLFRAGIVPRLPALIEQFERVVTTDLSPAQLVSLACMAEQVPPERIGLFKIDGALVAETEVGERAPVLVPDIALIRTRLAEWLEE